MKLNIAEEKKELAALIPKVMKKLDEVTRLCNRLSTYDKGWIKIFNEWTGIFHSFEKMLSITKGGHGMGNLVPGMAGIINEALLFRDEIDNFNKDLSAYYNSTADVYNDFARQTKNISDESLGRILEAMRAKVTGDEFPVIIKKGNDLLKECSVLQTRLDVIDAKLKAAKPMAS